MRKATQLRHHPHSPESKTDVWAFGVLLWEIMTLVFVPYNTIGDDEAVAEAVIAGRRLPKPETCSDDVYSIMLSCRAKQPGDRPDMPEVHMTRRNGPVTRSSVLSRLVLMDSCRHSG